MHKDNSRAEKLLPCAARGQRHHQPPLRPRREGPAARGRGEGTRPASSPGPGGPEGHRRADEQGVQRFRSCRGPPPGLCLPPSPGASTLRPPAGPVTTPQPGRRTAYTRGPYPSDPTRPLPRTQPGPSPAHLPGSPELRDSSAPPRQLRAPRRGTDRPPGRDSPGRGDSGRDGHRRLLLLSRSPSGEQKVAVKAPPKLKRISPPSQPSPPSPFTRPRRPEKMSPEAVPLGASLPPGTTESALVG